jgi:glycosyltransferase involved in cell wall biosynthesis
MADILAEDFPAGSVCVIENGIDTEAFVRPASLLPNAAPEISLKIGIAGRLVPVKRVDIFIRTAKHLHDAHRELGLDFRIYGDGPLLEELEALARSLETESYLHFEGHCADIHNALRGLDMLLMTSDHEGLPMILLEAMALEIPVIAHSVGGINELLAGGECGVLVNEQSPEKYANAVRELIVKPELRERLARKALQHIASRYTATRNAEEYCAVYKEILRSAGRTVSGA